jgi:SPW repeat
MADLRRADTPEPVRDPTADPPEGTQTDWVDDPATGYRRARHAREPDTEPWIGQEPAADRWSARDRDTESRDRGFTPQPGWEPAGGATGAGGRTGTGVQAGPSAIAASAPSAIALLGGVWLLISRLVFDYPAAGSSTDGVLNGVTVGIAVALVALALMTSANSNPVLGLVLAALGGWMIASPWVFNYSHWGSGGRPAWSDAVTGAAIILTGLVTWLAGTARQLTAKADGGR